MSKDLVVFNSDYIKEIEILNATNKPHKAKLKIVTKQGESFSFKIKIIKKPNDFNSYHIKRNYVHSPNAHHHTHQTIFAGRKGKDGSKKDVAVIGNKSFHENIERIIAGYEQAVFHIQANIG